MEINVLVSRVEMKRSTNWAIQVEVEQKSYGEGQSSQKRKQRTEVSSGASLVFSRNLFTFDISLSNRIVLKFGVLEVSGNLERIESSSMQCLGVHSRVITKNLLSQLRNGSTIEKSFTLKHPENSSETGRVFIQLRLNPYGTEERIIENDRRLEQVKFDVYETDSCAVTEKAKKTEKLLVEKDAELSTWTAQVDHLKNAVRSLGVDSALLRKEKSALERQHTALRTQLNRYQNVDDLHIKFDLLSTSSQGIRLLKVEYEKLKLRLRLECVIYKQHSEHWESLAGKQRKLEELETSLAEIKDARRQLEFTMLRLNAQFPEVTELRNSVSVLNILIGEYEGQLLRLQPSVPDKSLALELQSARHKQVLLSEKHKQVALLLEANEGAIPLNLIDSLTLLATDRESSELSNLRQRSSELVQEIQELSAGLTVAPHTGMHAIEVQVKLEAAEERVNAMQQRMDLQAAEQAKVVAEYVGKSLEYDGRIQSLRRGSLYKGNCH